MDFAVGDTVRLKSGGSIMTVDNIEGDKVTCVWSVKGDIKRETFTAASLQKASREFPSASFG